MQVHFHYTITQSHIQRPQSDTSQETFKLHVEKHKFMLECRLDLINKESTHNLNHLDFFSKVFKHSILS